MVGVRIQIAEHAKLTDYIPELIMSRTWRHIIHKDEGYVAHYHHHKQLLVVRQEECSAALIVLCGAFIFPYQTVCAEKYEDRDSIMPEER